MRKRVLAVKAENCTGCRMCELACSSSKEGEFIPDRSRVRVVHNGLEGWSRPSICLQCEDAMCMAVCPAEAISKGETANGDRFIKVDREKCIGCRRCVAACPFGAMNFFKETRAVKCDLCGGAPKCAEFCFYGCLNFVELSDEEYEKRARKIKSLTVKACREIAKKAPHRRREAFSLDASKTTPIPEQETGAEVN